MALMSAEIHLTSQNWQNSAVLNPTIFLNLASLLTLMSCLVIRKVPQLMCLVVIFIVVIKGNLEGPGARNYLRHISYVVFMTPFPSGNHVLPFIHVTGLLIRNYCWNIPDGVSDPVSVIEQNMYQSISGCRNLARIIKVICPTCNDSIIDWNEKDK